ncbi:hypothetical protein P171DRAFT_364432 [Karstenula rhodostoma CBS 690.94]|uniref:RRM domain-containing protein n=1 Tax=Karstenula rhodostoma CBS 690.94 TaxID=1392251 RepID=A0A9P4PCF5_9PLEO|nr:hypothetical protein P171DRAFT_364432 [Karstenula rhodostoma CBS 690.94]
MNGDGYSRADGGRSGGGRDYVNRGDRGGDRGGDREDRRRRRSRSPRHNSRRDYEVDTYSSSRDYRERERETTYARRERRDDRNWGDSYARRDRPRNDRDDDRGHGRRDRNDREFEDRGRGGGGGGGRRGGGGGGGGDGGFGGGGRDRRQKSASPPYKKREPTPDLTSFVSILNHPRRMTQWDIKPAGYDNITAEQAKLSGQFPLPGAPRAAPMDPSKLAAFTNPETGTASTSGLLPSNSLQARRLFIYNIPQEVTNDDIVEFWNLQLNGLNVVSGRDPCVSAQIASNRTYAAITFKTAEDATVALAMDNIAMRDGDQVGLSIRRPKDYITPVADATATTGDTVSSHVADSPNKLSITNIPTYVEEEQVRELVETFGALKAFVLVKDTSTEQHRGIAFCEYVDPEIVEHVIEGLNSIPLGEGTLKVTRATIGLQQQIAIDGGVGAISMLAGATAADTRERSRVICLMNMVTPDELLNDDEYDEIKEDIAEECSKYGTILEVKIPRPAGVRSSAGVGKIYIKYEDAEKAQTAIKSLAGRQFSRRTVLATEFSEEGFDVEAW